MLHCRLRRPHARGGAADSPAPLAPGIPRLRCLALSSSFVSGSDPFQHEAMRMPSTRGIRWWSAAPTGPQNLVGEYAIPPGPGPSCQKCSKHHAPERPLSNRNCGDFRRAVRCGSSPPLKWTGSEHEPGRLRSWLMTTENLPQPCLRVGGSRETPRRVRRGARMSATHERLPARHQSGRIDIHCPRRCSWVALSATVGQRRQLPTGSSGCMAPPPWVMK